MISLRKTKIVTTLGPAVASKEAVTRLILAGMNVARINFSHGDHQQHSFFFELVKECATELNRSVAVLGDLSGPKIRTGNMEKPLMLEAGFDVTISSEDGNGDIKINNAIVLSDLKPGNLILLDDGYIELEVVSESSTLVKCRIISGGLLKSHKGVNFPDLTLSIPVVTEKDKKDAWFGKDLGLDYFALSFVQNANDIKIIKEIAGRTPVIAKIERPQAVANLDSIIKVADGFMVARGDLGVEIGPQNVPAVQKLMIRKARQYSKPVITATQILESMINNPAPTRAEVSDIANGVLDGTSALMLSGETAVGKYPFKAVEMLASVIEEVENNNFFKINSPEFAPHNSFSGALSQTAVEIASRLKLKLIVVFSQTGQTAKQISRYRPGRNIVAFTSQLETLNQLSLHWGIIPIYFKIENFKDLQFTKLTQILLEKKLVKPHDKIVITFGSQNNKPGRTDAIKLHTIPANS
ncbi:MAG: pyruvate kinase [Deltaproteobacteria bacterium]|jgi:pyruvate kinase|nr:pyruvate kinase [Deltaproteobacteria bacterium]